MSEEIIVKRTKCINNTEIDILNLNLQLNDGGQW